VDLDGKALAERIRLRHRGDVEALRTGGRSPRLVSVEVGRSEAADSYVRGQRRGAEAWGIGYEVRSLPADATEEEVSRALLAASADPAATGVLLQLPLPPHLPTRSLQRCIAPKKDVEGVHPENLGHVVHGTPGLSPCTALAVLELLESSGAPIRGAEAVVVGHSDIVGKPVALLLLARDASVTVCHKFTKDLAAHTRRADLLVVAVGRAGLVTTDHVKAGAVVVDVGINAVPDPAARDGKTRLVGDVDYAGLTAKGCHVTPVPGGVGPVTVAMLMRNVVLAAGRTPAPVEPATPTLFPTLD
jgi:methylenetetrahydrofolate dehydrogenase (NADP+) / methenyltetrahydrofolate cyclohydrolase